VDGSFVYIKTPKGVAEIAARGAQLAMTTRRVLIMIDGKRTVDEVSVLVRPGEIGGIMAQLEGGGFIQRAGGSLDVPTVNGRDADFGVGSGPNTGGFDDRDAMTLDEAKRRAVRELTDRLGPGAEAVALRIEGCRTVEEFRSRVREAERVVAAALGANAAQDYLRVLRRRS
jgi:hypothetical protein